MGIYSLVFCYGYATTVPFLQLLLIENMHLLWAKFAWVSGLEMYTLYLSKSGLKLVEHKKANVTWYVYTHESRLVLLASGMQCKTLSGYQVVYPIRHHQSYLDLFDVYGLVTLIMASSRGFVK